MTTTKSGGEREERRMLCNVVLKNIVYAIWAGEEGEGEVRQKKMTGTAARQSSKEGEKNSQSRLSLRSIETYQTGI